MYIIIYKNLIILIKVYYKDGYILQKVLITKTIIILLKFIITVPLIYKPFFKGQNYIFNTIYTGTQNVIIKHVNFITITNPFNKLKTILTKAKLSIIIKYKKEGYYYIKEF
jgi:hypothetical protein